MIGPSAWNNTGPQIDHAFSINLSASISIRSVFPLASLGSRVSYICTPGAETQCETSKKRVRTADDGEKEGKEIICPDGARADLID